MRGLIPAALGGATGKLRPRTARALTPVGPIRSAHRVMDNAPRPAALAPMVDATTLDADALHQQALQHLAAGNPATSLPFLERALASRPEDPRLHNDLGCALFGSGRLADAAAAFCRALTLHPQFAEPLKNLGDVAAVQGDHAAAAARYERALALQPGFFVARVALAHSLFHRRDYAAALPLYEAEAARAPDDVLLQAHLAYCLIQLRRPSEAAAPAARALALAPQAVETQIVDGYLAQQLGRLDDAIAAFRRAHVLRPDHLSAANHLGAALIARNAIPEAIAVLRDACARLPHVADLRYNLAFAELAAGDFAAGWENYEFRAIMGAGYSSRNYPVPAWDGREPLAGRTILLHGEQGLGDTIQFARFAPQVAQLGARVILGVQHPLRTLFDRFPGVHGVTSLDAGPPPFDTHCPLLSLPRLLGVRLDTIPAAIPYLAAPPEKIAAWRAALPPGRKIGFVWRGNPAHAQDHARSIPLGDLLAVTRDVPAQFFSLQKDPPPADRAALAAVPHVTDLADRLGDFTDTAAIITQLDAVVTVDTAVAHLAGALGARVYLLVAFAADWRWLLDRADSPWYPTLRIFRQPAPGAWQPAVEQVRLALFAAEART